MFCQDEMRISRLLRDSVSDRISKKETHVQTFLWILFEEVAHTAHSSSRKEFNNDERDYLTR